MAIPVTSLACARAQPVAVRYWNAWARWAKAAVWVGVAALGVAVPALGLRGDQHAALDWGASDAIAVAFLIPSATLIMLVATCVLAAVIAVGQGVGTKRRGVGRASGWWSSPVVAPVPGYWTWWARGVPLTLRSLVLVALTSAPFVGFGWLTIADMALVCVVAGGALVVLLFLRAGLAQAGNALLDRWLGPKPPSP